MTPRRRVVYVVSAEHGHADPMTVDALRQLRAHAAQLTVVHGPRLRAAAQDTLREIADDLVKQDGEYSPRWYLNAIDQEPGSAIDETVLTGDGVLGPIVPLDAMVARMASVECDLWQLVENEEGEPESFPAQGFPVRHRPWAWTVFRSAVIGTPGWRAFWNRDPAEVTEAAVPAFFRGHGHTVAAAFARDDFPSRNPLLHDSALLLAAGSPFLSKLAFQLYPPFLNRQAVLGRDIVAAVEATGYDMHLFWDSLARTTPPKTLNTNAGMLEVIGGDGAPLDDADPFRVAVVARVTDLTGLDVLLERVGYLPQPVDVFVTTTDGRRASEIEAALERWREGSGAGIVEVRVTPAKSGRDMGDFFVACRDVLRSGGYDIVVKLHVRRAARKTANVRRYFARYQFDNLLASPAHAREVLALFRREPGLGLVFPPMVHIGYATMGRGWAGLQDAAARMCRRLDIQVPQDEVSPLAPYGGMWFARVEALQQLTRARWSFSDYRRAKGTNRLGKIQERLVVAAAAQLGYHSRTVLTPEHAAISHTALEYKTDEMFSTTRGYPVEQIQLLHRAGYTGYGGPVALLRMYLRLNHPRMIAVLRRPYHLAFRVYGTLAGVRMRRAARLDAAGGSEQ